MTRWTVHFIWAGLLVSIVALSRAETSTESTTTDDAKAKAEFPAQTKIGVVDVKFIFTNYKQFDERMKAISAKVEAAEAKIRSQQVEIKKLAEQAKQANTNHHHRPISGLEKKVVERQNLLTAEMEIQKQEILQQENTVYADTMNALDRHIAEYAKKHGLHIVLRINAETPNPKVRNEIAMGLSKNVFYFDPKIDITPEILKAINED
jgi:Skp family chaperone for outer membrane proteins